MQYILQNHPARENQVTEDFEAMMAADEQQQEVVTDAMMQANTTSIPF
jgi:hypothetical protein